MTEQPTGPKRPAGQRSWPWMIFSLVVIGGFFAWLAASSQQVAVAVVEDVEGVDGADAASVPALTVDELVAGIEGYVNRTVRIADVDVVSRLGGQMFWTMTRDGMPFLVKVSEGTEIEPQAVFELVGVVYERSDAVLSTWEAMGVIADEGERMEAEFAMWYVEASELRRVDGES